MFSLTRPLRATSLHKVSLRQASYASGSRRGVLVKSSTALLREALKTPKKQATPPPQVPEEEIEQQQEFDETDNEKSFDYLQKFRIGSIILPKELQGRISSVLRGYSRKTLRQDATDLSNLMRERTRVAIPNSPDVEVHIAPEDKPVISYGRNQTMAYVAHRLPGVYSCTYRVMDEISKRDPDFAPKSLLDFGSGPGTVVWSANQVWPDSLKQILAIEPSSTMTEAAKDVLKDYPQVKWQRYLMQGTAAEALKYDLVTSSYVLSELNNDKARRASVKALWKSVAPGGMLVIVEPGTPVGFSIVKDMRAMSLGEFNRQDTPTEAKANVIAPCPHSLHCPMGSNSWCHFVQRVVRTPLQLAAKERASVNYEDEKFSYVVIRKGEKQNNEAKKEEENEEEEDFGEETWSRLVRQPLKRGGHVLMDVCSPSGMLQRSVVARSHGKVMYKEARKSSWGDGFILDEEKVNMTEGKYMRKKSKPAYIRDADYEEAGMSKDDSLIGEEIEWDDEVEPTKVNNNKTKKAKKKEKMKEKKKEKVAAASTREQFDEDEGEEEGEIDEGADFEEDEEDVFTKELIGEDSKLSEVDRQMLQKLMSEGKFEIEDEPRSPRKKDKKDKRGIKKSPTIPIHEESTQKSFQEEDVDDKFQFHTKEDEELVRKLKKMGESGGELDQEFVDKVMKGEADLSQLKKVKGKLTGPAAWAKELLHGIPPKDVDRKATWLEGVEEEDVSDVDSKLKEFKRKQLVKKAKKVASKLNAAGIDRSSVKVK